MSKSDLLFTNIFLSLVEDDDNVALVDDILCAILDDDEDAFFECCKQVISMAIRDTKPLGIERPGVCDRAYGAVEIVRSGEVIMVMLRSGDPVPREMMEAAYKEGAWQKFWPRWTEASK